MKNKLLATLLAVCLLAALTLSACQPTAQPPASEPTTNTSTSEPVSSSEPAPAPAEPVNIVYLDPIPTPERTEMLGNMIAEFNKKGIATVEYQSIPWDEAYKKIVSMGASDTMPDVIAVDEGMMKTLAAAEFLEPLDGYFANFHDKDDLSSTFLNSESGWAFRGNMYVVPDSFGCQGIFIRSDWLQEAGIDIGTLREWTWDQYFDVVQKLTNKDQNRYGIAFRGGANGMRMFFEYACSMMEVNSCFPDGNNQSIFSRPEMVDLFKNFYGMYVNGNAPTDSVNWGFQEMVEGFVTGQCGTLNQTPEVVLTCEASMQNGTWEVLPPPSKAGAQYNYINWGYTAGFSIAASSPNKDAAWEFISYVTEKENNLEYCKGFGYLPIYNSNLKDNYFQSGVMKGYADTLANPKSRLIDVSTLSQWGYFLAEFSTTEVQKYMSGIQSAEDTVANIAKWLSDEYDKEYPQ